MDNNDASVMQPTAGSADVENTAPANPKTKNDSVSYDTYSKTLEEAKKAKARLKELEAAEQKRNEEELQKRGEFQELLKARESDLERLQSELSTVRRRELDRLKLSSVLDAAGGDIDPKWYQLIEYDAVQVSESGDIDRTSVARVVENFKKSYPEVLRNPNAPRLPGNAPQGSGSGNKISRAAWMKLPSAEMRKWKHDQIVD